jgi:N6-L-threonylcarbamoyladenine synthase
VEGPGPGTGRPLILGIETSCDETAAAVVTGDGVVLSNIISSQAQVHAPYGGVVPEIASRRHLEVIVPVVERALDEAGVSLAELDAVAVTEGPGLIGALLVGLSAAKAIAFARGLPLVPVDHLHGHLAALYLQPDAVEPPFLALLASGGHTLILEVSDHRGYRCIGGTLDDAAGEAFDKGARLLGLGYPGGARLERLAAEGDPAAHTFPAGMLGRAGYDLSFSGLKTALRYALVRDPEASRADLAAAYQAAIVRSLVERTAAAVVDTGASTLAVVGGVARNGALRDAFARRCADLGVRLALVAPELCSDNAAMIASAARYADAIPFPGYLRRDAYATAS